MQVGPCADTKKAFPLPSSSARPFRRLPRPVLRRPARGRPCPPAARCGPGGRDVREPRPPRGSQAVQTLTHSCLERRRGPPPPFLLRGGRAADGLRGGSWQAARTRALSTAGLRGPGCRRARAARSWPVPGRSFRRPEAGRRSGSYLRRLGWASAPPNTWGPGLLGQWAEDTVGPGMATSACGPGGDRGAR